MVQRIMQRLPEGIDKDEYELTKWSTMIHQLIVMETSQTLEVPMKSKDTLVAWIKNHAKLPERIDKDEYELIKWSTMISAGHFEIIAIATSDRKYRNATDAIATRDFPSVSHISRLRL